jgi:hypothetical protein
VGVEYAPAARQQVIDSLSSVVVVNPQLVAGVVVFVAMVDGSVLVLHTCCCLKHAHSVAQDGISQAARVAGWHCPREG